MGVIQTTRHRGHDPYHVLDGDPRGVAIGEQARGVETVDVVHRDPQLAADFAAVVHPHDVWMPQGRGEIGLPDEPGPVVVVGRPLGRQQLERVAPRKSWVLGEVHLTHPSGAQQTHNRETGEGRTVQQRHAPDRTHASAFARRRTQGDPSREVD